ncbi:MAG: 30S ribosomal protein S20 [Anaerolineaceae bacterium]|nr:MAG: 30S ribosomal protein S20 [Anaerolineaceae bacterium]
MANLRSAKKRIRQNAKRRMRNRVYRTRARTFVKHARLAIESGDSDAATDAVRKAVSELDRASSKGVIHRKNAARRKSRLMKRLASLEQST